MKIILSCKSGPELLELICLENSWLHEEVLLYTDKTNQVSALKDSYRIKYASRVGLNPFLFLKSLIDSLSLVLKEKPEIVIAVASSTTFWLLFFAKIFGSKLVVIEPFYHVNFSGFFARIVYRFADLFLVQWEDLLDKYPKAEYVGRVF